jgi:hypothetical protein
MPLLLHDLSGRLLIAGILRYISALPRDKIYEIDEDAMIVVLDKGFLIKCSSVQKALKVQDLIGTYDLPEPQPILPSNKRTPCTFCGLLVAATEGHACYRKHCGFCGKMVPGNSLHACSKRDFA